MASEAASPRRPGPAACSPSPDPFADVPAEAWREAWDSSPAVVTVVWGPDQLLVFQNRASEAMFGPRQIGIPLDQAFPEVPGPSAALEGVMRTGETVRTPPRRIDVRDVRGEDVVMSYVLAPLGDPPSGVVIAAIDVTAQVRAEEAAARTSLLVDITGAMTRASDAAAALKALTDALVPAVADLAAVYVVPDGQPGEGPPLPPEVLTLSDELAVLGTPPQPAEQQEPSPYDALLRTGAPVLIPLEGDALATVARDPENAAWLRAAEGRNVVIAPLVVAGTLTGALVLLAAGDREPFCEADLPFLLDVSARAGSAIAQLRTIRRQRDVAVDLQRGLLPSAPPEIAGVQIAARYVAGAPDVEVGGDWWDVHDLGNRRMALGIGDVSGRGVPAAAVMGQARAVMRAAGHARLAPVAALELLDAQLSDALAVPEGGEPGPQPTASGRAPVRFATACYAVLDLTAMEVRLANAGHLPLLVRAADGAVRELRARPGAPLGLGVGGFVEAVGAVQPGDTLVMFTDGLVESRVLDIDDGLAMLAGALERHGGSDVEWVADALLTAMERRQGYGPDDVALVVVRVDHSPSPIS